VLPCRLNDLDAVVFSAFDASTHLQIARIYLTNTLASALDFAEFFLHKFPFPVKQIRTLTENPFYLAQHPATEQRFSNHLAVRGVLHSCCVSASRDPIFTLASTLVFSPLSTAPANASLEELSNEFSNFLFYHNNRRLLSSLQSRTPLQKLKTFAGFAHLDSFDPFAR
jgi:hypothetical protein